MCETINSCERDDIISEILVAQAEFSAAFNVSRGTSEIRLMAETAGDRLYLIRLALGDGFRKAMPIPRFVEHVRAVTGADYHDATISLLERMKQNWRVDDALAFAAVDPKGRGAAWLAFGTAGGSVHEHLNPTAQRKLTDAETARALRTAASERREQAAKAVGKAAGAKKRR
jgi:hypothetical protein